MGSVQELERSMIREYATESRAVAKSKGMIFGHKPTLNKAQVAQNQTRAFGRQISGSDCARLRR